MRALVLTKQAGKKLKLINKSTPKTAKLIKKSLLLLAEDVFILVWITNLAFVFSDNHYFASWRVTFFLLAQKQSHQTKKAPYACENSA